MDGYLLTIEELLSIHRGWITKLYIEDRKTEVEIVQELYKENLEVTVSQIRKCIRDWNLLRLSSTSSVRCNSLYQTSQQFPVYSPRSEPRTFNSSEFEALYTNRALPELPSSSRTSPTRYYTTSNSPSTSTYTSYTISSSPTMVPCLDSSTRTSTSLSGIPNGPTPLETYTSTNHSHERIAIGLEYEEDENVELRLQVLRSMRESSRKKGKIETAPRRRKKRREERK